jgi:hypothetical protein
MALQILGFSATIKTVATMLENLGRSAHKGVRLRREATGLCFSTKIIKFDTLARAAQFALWFSLLGVSLIYRGRPRSGTQARSERQAVAICDGCD